MISHSQRVLIKMIRRRVKVIRPELLPRGAFIIVGNHQSYLDPIPMWFAVAEHRDQQTFFLAKHQLRRYFGRLGSWLGMIYINPKDKASTLTTARKHLEQGHSIGIFPEGERNYASKINLLKGKTGAARLALTTNLPVVPTGVIAPPGYTMPQAIKSYFFTRVEYSITIGQPIKFEQPALENITHKQLEDTTRTIMKAVGQLSNKHYPY
jgi:1-acyl-sn-glycerol-3-phosphate acyltransferase